MTFARPLAIHNILLPGPTYTITDKMAALYALWEPGGASTLYTASLQTEIDTASPGAGSYSFLLKRDGAPNSPQYNLRNSDTPAAPNATYAYVAINPDGDLDEIVDSVNVQNGSAATPANQNGTLGRGCLQTQVGTSDLLQVFEFDDAIIVLGWNTALGYHHDFAHFGNIIEPRWSDDVDGGGVYNLRLGLGTLGGHPNNQGYIYEEYAFVAYPNYASYGCSWRLGLGNSISVAPTPTFGGAWTTYNFIMFQLAGDLLEGWSNLGEGSNKRFARMPALLTQGSRIGQFKYLKLYPNQFAGRIWRKDGADYLLSAHYGATAAGDMWVHTTASYNPLAVGVYT